MIEPTPAAKWKALAAVLALVVAVWWYVDWKSQPPPPPAVPLPYPPDTHTVEPKGK